MSSNIAKYTENEEYKLIKTANLLKIFNNENYKSSFIKECEDSMIANNYDNFTYTYIDILFMHLQIFLNINKFEGIENKVKDFINYICIYLLLQSFFSINLKKDDEGNINEELYKKIINMLKSAITIFTSDDLNNINNKMHMYKIINNIDNNKINKDFINTYFQHIEINNVNVTDIKEKFKNTQSGGTGNDTENGKDSTEEVSTGNEEVSTRNGQYSTENDTGNEDASTKEGNFLLHAFKIKIINEIMFYKKDDLNSLFEEFKIYEQN